MMENWANAKQIDLVPNEIIQTGQVTIVQNPGPNWPKIIAIGFSIVLIIAIVIGIAIALPIANSNRECPANNTST